MEARCNGDLTDIYAFGNPTLMEVSFSYFFSEIIMKDGRKIIIRDDLYRFAHDFQSKILLFEKHLVYLH